jgi:O-succinylbenzoate synthase
MKISNVNLYHLRLPLKSAFETSFARIHTRDSILIEAFAGDLVGYGECVADRDPGYSYETAATAWHILRDYLIPSIRYREISSPGEVPGLLHHVRGHPMAKSGLEMVYWDLQGKSENRSLKELIGGTRGNVDVGVSVGIQDTPEALVEVVRGYLAQGYGRIKIKIKPGRDVAETAAVRQAFPKLRLQVDANSAYTLETAAALAPLDDLDLLLIEQPLSEDDIWDHHYLQERMKTPICLDESILSARHARQAIEMGSCRVINIKTGRVGGLSQAVSVHNVCQEHGIPVWCGGMLETGVGRAANLALASLPGFTLPGDISATDRYYEQDITCEHFMLDTGSTIRVPDKPGLGVTVDMQALKRFTLDTLHI